MPMEPLHLHPNLARIAVEYQRVRESLERFEINVNEANRRIRDLTARDDNGVTWSINPADGGWMYWSLEGKWVPADPPRHGIATVTPYQLSNTSGGDPDLYVSFNEVDTTARTLAGATRRRQQRRLIPVTISMRVLIVAAITIGAALFVVQSCGDGTAPMAPGVPAENVLSFVES